MPLQFIEIDADPIEMPPEVERFITVSQKRIEAFWDRFESHSIYQYVASDFQLVWSAFEQLRRNELVDGNSFCEWGCGFGVVAGLAWMAGWNAVGIEAESFLVDGGKKLLDEFQIKAELFTGNFLPAGAERLERSGELHPSIRHPIPPIYSQIDLEIDDFGLIFVYPWPGEEGFIYQVFEKYARPGAVLLAFLGPYQLEAYKKVSAKG